MNRMPELHSLAAPSQPAEDAEVDLAVEDLKNMFNLAPV